jgi:hypothetical protein
MEKGKMIFKPAFKKLWHWFFTFKNVASQIVYGFFDRLSSTQCLSEDMCPFDLLWSEQSMLSIQCTKNIFIFLESIWSQILATLNQRPILSHQTIKLSALWIMAYKSYCYVYKEKKNYRMWLIKVLSIFEHNESDMNFLRHCGWPNQLGYGKSG